MDDNHTQDPPLPDADTASSEPPATATMPRTEDPHSPLVRHATPPPSERGRMAIIATCATLAGVILGFVLSTAVYRESGRCTDMAPSSFHMAPTPPEPPPRSWGWHQHGDRDDNRHGCDASRRRGHWSPPPPAQPSP